MKVVLMLEDIGARNTWFAKAFKLSYICMNMTVHTKKGRFIISEIDHLKRKVIVCFCTPHDPSYGEPGKLGTKLYKELQASKTWTEFGHKNKKGKSKGVWDVKDVSKILKKYKR